MSLTSDQESRRIMGTLARSTKSSAPAAQRSDSRPRPAFTLNEVRVLANDSHLLSMLSVFLAAGAPKGREPWRYMNNPDRRRFIDDLARDLGMKSVDLVHFGGSDPNDYFVHPQVIIDYAGEINNRFKIAIGKAIKEWAEEELDPGLKVERGIQAYRDRGLSDEWIALRFKSIHNRHEFNRTLKEHGVERDGYAKCTDALNIKIHGGTSRELKARRGVKNVRDSFDEDELARTIFGERLATKKVRDERAHGNTQCVAACRMAGDAVRMALDFMNRQRLNP